MTSSSSTVRRMPHIQFLPIIILLKENHQNILLPTASKSEKEETNEDSVFNCPVDFISKSESEFGECRLAASDPPDTVKRPSSRRTPPPPWRSARGVRAHEPREDKWKMAVDPGQPWHSTRSVTPDPLIVPHKRNISMRFLCCFHPPRRINPHWLSSRECDASKTWPVDSISVGMVALSPLGLSGRCWRCRRHISDAHTAAATAAATPTAIQLTQLVLWLSLVSSASVSVKCAETRKRHFQR